MKIVCVGYREWALNIYKNISCNSPHNFLFIKSKESYSEELILNYDPDLVFFYGWSWKVSNEIITRFKCLMLHPSPLPKYRGGSPIQNQIINGETKSQVTIFLMNKELDAGPILSKDFLSLDGNIKDILKRIEIIGTNLTKELLEIMPKGFEQNHNEATYFKRLKIKSSEISFEEFKNKDSSFLYNKIRMLTDPYPNAYIKTKDGKFLLFKEVELYDEYPFK